ncbi:hypothetical protein CONPUDRAFT_147203, partial [Coniophora puteana RWD-64-598 SS2]
MLLRVYTLYKASRRLMCILTVCFVLEMACVIFALQWGIYSSHGSDYNFLIAILPWAGFEILLLTLILKESLEHRKDTWGATRVRWNPLLKIIVRDSGLFFLGYVG